MCFLLLPLEAISATGQKYNLPTDEVSVLEKLEQKKPFSSQPSELSPETTGIAKPEEGRPSVSVTGNDITTPPNKELPPSPEKKTKVVARMVGYLLPLWLFLDSIFSYYCLNHE